MSYSVLLLENEAFKKETILSMLEMVNCVVVPVATAEVVLGALDAFIFDVVVVSASSVEASDIALAAKMAQPNLKVVALGENLQEPLELLIDSFISPPFTLPNLRAAIRNSKII